MSGLEDLLKENGSILPEETEKTAEEIAAQTNALGQQGNDSPNPPASAPKPTETQQEINDEQVANFLKTKYGVEFQGEDDFRSLSDRMNLAKTYESEKEKLETEKRFYNKPFFNEQIEKFNSFVKHTGIDNHDLFKKLSNIDPDLIDPIEAIALKRVMDQPQLADDYDKVVKLVKRTYPITSSGDSDEDDEDWQMEQLSLKSEKLTAVKALLELKGTAFKTEAHEPWSEEKSNELGTKWGDASKQIVGHLSEKNFSFKLKGDETFSFELPDDKKALYAQDVVEIAKANRMPLNADNVKLITASIYNRIRLENFDAILQAATTHLLSEEVRLRIEKNSNPSSDKPNGKPFEKGAETQEELYARIHRDG